MGKRRETETGALRRKRAIFDSGQEELTDGGRSACRFPHTKKYVLRRSGRTREEERKTIVYGNLVLDLDNYSATVKGNVYELTQREFEVLRELLTHQGRVLTRQNLLDRLWRYDFYGDERVVDTHIKNLRKKLGIDFIQTVRGVGYKIDKET